MLCTAAVDGTVVLQLLDLVRQHRLAQLPLPSPGDLAHGWLTLRRFGAGDEQRVVAQRRSHPAETAPTTGVLHSADCKIRVAQSLITSHTELHPALLHSCWLVRRYNGERSVAR